MSQVQLLFSHLNSAGFSHFPICEAGMAESDVRSPAAVGVPFPAFPPARAAITGAGLGPS